MRGRSSSRRQAAPIVWALFREQLRINKSRSADRVSYLEAEVASEGIQAATKIRDEAVANLGKLTQQAVQLRGTITLVEADMARLATRPIVGAHDELLTATEGEQRQSAVDAQIRKETGTGSLKHRRVPKAIRLAALLVPVVDLPVFTLFAGDMFNVAWDQVAEGRALLPAITSVVFGLLATAGLALALHVVGFDLRGTKDAQGQPNIPKGRPGMVSRLLIAGVASLGILTAVVMGFRVIRESLAAEVGVPGAVILGLFFACVVAVLNLVVAVTVFRDGSVLTDELSHLRRQLRPVRKQRQRLERKRDELANRIDLLIAKGQQVRTLTVLKMARPIAGADQLRAIARSLHQGCGWGVEFLPVGRDSFGLFAPATLVDTSVLDELVVRLEGLAVRRDAAEAGDGKTSGSPNPATANGQKPPANTVATGDQDTPGGITDAAA
ncbi:hypothetical protein IU459_15680 [Nocardia amamiensis]|uniref:Uncharacterized protein n=1 Tax=Nocardia amamiensis TaxID=404578 RepID=A0ABS0CQS6_9NOCA|nr:hypothetical protein [Nocardia amamiensis]MBF6298973.1 hypothetical protein [Nocardia amamiensis]